MTKPWGKFFANFCGLLRKAELYHWTFYELCSWYLDTVSDTFEALPRENGHLEMVNTGIMVVSWFYAPQHAVKSHHLQSEKSKTGKNRKSKTSCKTVHGLNNQLIRLLITSYLTDHTSVLPSIWNLYSKITFCPKNWWWKVV